MTSLPRILSTYSLDHTVGLLISLADLPDPVRNITATFGERDMLLVEWVAPEDFSELPLTYNISFTREFEDNVVSVFL